MPMNSQRLNFVISIVVLDLVGKCFPGSLVKCLIRLMSVDWVSNLEMSLV